MSAPFATGFYVIACLVYGGVLKASGMPLLLLLPVAFIGGVVMFGAMFGRIQERRNAVLRLTQDEVRRLARMNERERIGRDLHDLLGHTLSLIAIKSELAGKLIDRDVGAPQRRSAKSKPSRARRWARCARRSAASALSGFSAELATARLSLLSAGVSLDARIPALPQLASEIESALALSLREAVTNIVRHAGGRPRRSRTAVRSALAGAVDQRRRPRQPDQARQWPDRHA